MQNILIFGNLFIRYTFCGLAAMILIGEASRLDLPRLIVRELFPSYLLASNYSCEPLKLPTFDVNDLIICGFALGLGGMPAR